MEFKTEKDLLKYTKNIIGKHSKNLIHSTFYLKELRIRAF
ncbi:hypothetical protein Ctaglu_38810 [Clostridium tagluense]|uniref:Uncharacterized protein n=1 Tax=Clostridium tagluense TaxID=360422 RepID=A0A401US11_9CLOT|nr:hypothetical protein Ctaglu_38810 [Clostridium tagluense]